MRHTRGQPAPELLAAFWEPRLPGKIAKRIALAEPLPGHTIELEGNDQSVTSAASPKLRTARARI
jgi:hypothetical protein